MPDDNLIEALDDKGNHIGNAKYRPESDDWWVSAHGAGFSVASAPKAMLELNMLYGATRFRRSTCAA